MSWQNGDTLYFPDRQSLWAFSINYNMCIIEKRPDGTYGLDSSETYALSDSLLTICFSPQDIWKLRFGFSAGGDTLHLELADPGNGETAGVLFTKDDQFPASDYCGFEVSE